MRALVTGGAGFIGSHLVDRLVELGHDVVVLDNFKGGNKLPKETIAKIDLREGDVRNETAMLQAARGADVIFHFAAVLGVDIVADNPVATMETEYEGLRHASRAAILNGGCKLVYASTSGVYGKAAIARAVEEDFDVAPSSSYAIAKRFNEIYLAALHQEKSLPSVSLRFFNVYGPRQDARMVIPRFFQQALRGEPLTVYGSGGQTRDFTYIDDVVESIVRVAERVHGCEVINVAYSREYTIRELADRIKELCQSPAEIVHLNPPRNRYDFEVERRVGSSKKLETRTGYCPNTTLEAGLERTLAWLRGGEGVRSTSIGDKRQTH